MGCMGDMHRPFILDQFDLEEMCYILILMQKGVF